MGNPSNAVSRRGPIGVFDSGVGGLSVLRAIWDELPGVSTFYVADSINCPYGARLADEVVALSDGISRFLIARECQVVVLACNTASAVALGVLRQRYADVVFVGMVPAVKPAARMTRSGVVGVLATPNTFGGQLYHDVIDRFADGVHVISQVCEGWVGCVERGDLDSPETERMVRACVEPLLAAGADTLVLGCTHYPFLMGVLRRVCGDGLQLVEPSVAIARQVGRVYGPARSTRIPQPQHTFFTTGDPTQSAQQIQALVGVRAQVTAVGWRDGQLLEVG